MQSQYQRCNFIIQIHKFTIKIDTISVNLLFECVKIVEFNFNSHVFLVMYQEILSVNQDVFFKSRRETTVSSFFSFLLTSCKKFYVPPIGIFFHTVPAVLQKGEQTFEKFSLAFGIQKRCHLEFQLVFSFSVPLGKRTDQKLSSLFLI